MLRVLSIFALLCVALVCVSAVETESEVEWVQPSFIESLSELNNFDNPALDVNWEKPRAEDINHQDHRRVHVTLMAQHLDIAQEYNKAGNGVGVNQHVDAADKHNKAAVLHRKADTDVDFIEPAVKASRLAWKKSRALVRRVKKNNMVPSAQQTPKGAAAVQQLATMGKEQLAPEAVEVRQDNRMRGKDN